MAGKKTFDAVVDYLWKNRLKFDESGFYFDFPDYAGLPKSISYRLSSEFVDAIQDVTFSFGDFTRKSSFKQCLREKLLELGEKVIVKNR